jgi:uncharacterized coiled-coil protein SlyX
MSSSEMKDEGRCNESVIELESKLAYLERTVEVLADELQAQQSETRLLRTKLAAMQEQLTSLKRDSGVSDLPDQPPPHY